MYDIINKILTYGFILIILNVNSMRFEPTAIRKSLKNGIFHKIRTKNHSQILKNYENLTKTFMT